MKSASGETVDGSLRNIYIKFDSSVILLQQPGVSCRTSSEWRNLDSAEDTMQLDCLAMLCSL